jgi:acyl-CoA synthetase (AMP-forming)/AMP-acid ligase II
VERPEFDPKREREFIARGWWRDDDTLSHWLARHAAERPDAAAVDLAGTVLTWQALNERVLRVAEGLRSRGLRAGDVVAVQLPNVPEFLIAHLAIARLGAVMCTLHMPYRGAEIEALLRHSGARGAFCMPKAADIFRAVLADTPGTVVEAGPQFAELERSAPLAAGHPEPDARDPFLLLYTSGTTAAPKGVAHAYRTMLGNSRLGVREHGLGAADRILCAAPLSHLYGLYSLHCAWAVGACTVLLPAFTPVDLSVAIETRKPTALWTAPAHVAAVRAQGLFDKHDWSSLRLAIVSGSRAAPELVKSFAAKVPKCAVTQLWGMTEIQAGLYTRPGDPLEMSATCAGRPSPGTEIRLGEDGEIQVRGPLVFSGYLNNPAATRNAFTADGWFCSGDLAEKRDGNAYAIVGRSKDIINRGGVKFNPADVESLLDSHPKILQSAIVPMPDPILGEKACAFVVLKNRGEPVALEELVAYLLEKKIAKNKLPEKLVVIDEMPVTPTRKIIKGRLRIPGAQ